MAKKLQTERIFGVFGETRAQAAAKRDAYFAARPAYLARFVADASLSVTLRFDTSGTAVQTLSEGVWAGDGSDASKDYVDNLDSNNVKLTGDQTVFGKKTFDDELVVDGMYLGTRDLGNTITNLGFAAGLTNSGLSQTAVGQEAGRLNTGNSQTAVGVNAGRDNTGNDQTAFGVSAGNNNTGNSQTVVGISAGNNNTGTFQTAVGVFAGRNNTAGDQTVLGFEAGDGNTGTFQTAMGGNAGESNTGNHQVALGWAAGFQNTGNLQTALGVSAGRGNTFSNTLVLGGTVGAPYNNATKDNQAVIGNVSITETLMRGTVTSDTSTGALILPVGTTAQRPASPVEGMARVNSTTSAIEVYVNGGWV